MLKRFFNYIRDIWQGEDGKTSLRAIGAIALIYNFIENINWAIHKWEIGRSLEGLSLILGIEAGLITALLGLTAWTNMTAKKIDTEALSPQDTTINVQKADTVTTGTKVDTVNAKNVETVNTQTTNINKEPSSNK